MVLIQSVIMAEICSSLLIDMSSVDIYIHWNLLIIPHGDRFKWLISTDDRYTQVDYMSHSNVSNYIQLFHILFFQSLNRLKVANITQE